MVELRRFLVQAEGPRDSRDMSRTEARRFFTGKRFLRLAADFITEQAVLWYKIDHDEPVVLEHLPAIIVRL